MIRLRQTETRWARSFPTFVASSNASYTCTYERGKGPCNKAFSRKCDLRSVPEHFRFHVTDMSSSRHQRNHTKPSKCLKCNKGFPSPKDLERHDSCVHNKTVRYFCPDDQCRVSTPGWSSDGFPRKDHWQKHMKQKHSMSRDLIQALQTQGIPMAVLKDDSWIPVLPKQSETASREAGNVDF
ncbi:uncharacterized protein LY89DRAFT_138608 [Mollisia scopiformis]|uniref:C2H2-type domain-containing protein n=1 Tax=Mollisia scopiformis TaxID=149040 RepID=A0A194X2L6_MOLSC|nr:uncharacterized protein LY89DRAFT_138608 [Mollisia scopiformis]KUJ14423.1 hypothetical protein LY89DRAFT_138608 [Mollisia scopiformis]